MTMQRRPINSIEQRKLEVRKYSRNAVVSVAGGVVGGIALALIAESATWLLIGLVIAVVGGWVNWSKVQKIVNHKDV
ncbi:hypothetical protein NY035_09555 [Corynebacterium diphtheriae bv. mitis]|uniref:hypothetical protein n=1 Tax=Corynebacterium diphtheriae TaxID=1717 RepID=UPI000245A7EB|nr:hypothetical protein [Corynebacterium diphtheriae]OWN41729.1 hypothetical protein AY488_04105 [Corynebacterium belfantii]AEX42262.1 putative secreted protein [Corynebacterium diphtheriae 31A]AEX46780.1 putative secreted protein [Corynebacterium diphtheriae INCA 402]AEX49082.1 putative secreted protein [Corynebacterium diphtheriae BH8]AEX72473.1 putative secreted protein [Corynebacterium diphtheriae CDCE 8392]